jgi:hypothetical protein
MMEEHKTLFCCSKFGRVGEKFFAKMIDFGTRSQVVSRALQQASERFVSKVRHPTTAAVRQVLISVQEAFLSA